MGAEDHVIVGGPDTGRRAFPYKTTSLGMIVVLPDEEPWPEAVLKYLDVAELARLMPLARAEPRTSR